MDLVFVAVGGFFGAVLRFFIGEWMQTGTGFPFGTLVVNMVGCFALGWFLTYAKLRKLRNEWKFLLGTGFLGSFTTFSTFSVESLTLLENGKFEFASIYIALTIGIGILAAFFGFWLASKQGRVTE